MNKISIKLNDEDIAALAVLAQREYRNVPQQAALIIREELIQRGLLAMAIDCTDQLLPVQEAQIKQEATDAPN